MIKINVFEICLCQYSNHKASEGRGHRTFGADQPQCLQKVKKLTIINISDIFLIILFLSIFERITFIFSIFEKNI